MESEPPKSSETPVESDFIPATDKDVTHDVVADASPIAKAPPIAKTFGLCLPEDDLKAKFGGKAGWLETGYLDALKESKSEEETLHIKRRQVLRTHVFALTNSRCGYAGMVFDRCIRKSANPINCMHEGEAVGICVAITARLLHTNCALAFRRVQNEAEKTGQVDPVNLWDFTRCMLGDRKSNFDFKNKTPLFDKTVGTPEEYHAAMSAEMEKRMGDTLSFEHMPNRGKYMMEKKQDSFGWEDDPWAKNKK